MRMHAWVVYSSIKRASTVHANLQVLAGEAMLQCLACILYAIPLYSNHSYYLASKIPLVIYRKFLYFLISI